MAALMFWCLVSVSVTLCDPSLNLPMEVTKIAVTVAIGV